MISFSEKKFLPLVIGISVAVALALLWATWDINFWPTDAKVYYFDAAVQLPHFRYLSQIHDTIAAEQVRWLHGKEIFIVAVSWMQRLMHDVETLRPFMMVNILAVCGSSILVFVLARRYWGTLPGLVAYVAFAGSVWPYIYILFAKHQPLGLVLFLLAVLLLRFSALSGFLMGLSLFASTVSPLYLPFYAAAFFHEHRKGFLRTAAMAALVILAVLVYVNLPDVFGNIRRYLEYVHISGANNHFYYNQMYLQQWFGDRPVANIRGGWLWIIKYFFVIMPVLFPAYLASLGYLIWRGVRERSRPRWVKVGCMILLSLAPAVMAEIARVAQYGANYFPCLIGIIMLIVYALAEFRSDPVGLPKNVPAKAGPIALMVLGTLHLGLNMHAFLADVYPCRMATTFLSRKIKELGVPWVYAHKLHPQHSHFVLNVSPSIKDKVRFAPIDYIIQPKDGVIMVPPVTGDSIYIVAISTYGDFDRDVFLNELLRRGNLGDYAIASFKTLAASRLWALEEEIMSYRRLILNHKIDPNDPRRQVWLLDGAKLGQDINRNIPIKDYLDLHQKGIRNIGTKQTLYLYEGYTARVEKPTVLTRVLARMYKVGDPRDQLVAYVYNMNPKQESWVPAGEHFASRPLAGEMVIYDSKTGIGAFPFNPPLVLEPGLHFVAIYRTGPPDDWNYYRIYTNYLGML